MLLISGVIGLSVYRTVLSGVLHQQVQAHRRVSFLTLIYKYSHTVGASLKAMSSPLTKHWFPFSFLCHILISQILYWISSNPNPAPSLLCFFQFLQSPLHSLALLLKSSSSLTYHQVSCYNMHCWAITTNNLLFPALFWHLKLLFKFEFFLF